MHKRLVLLLVPFALTSCAKVSTSPNTSDANSSNIGQTDSNENNEENVGNIGENTGNSDSLNSSEWIYYEFHDGHKPAYNSDWDFYYGTSYEPGTSLWENPNEALDYSGIEFKDKKQYLESPEFEPCEMLEVKFEFFFSSHTSTKYQATPEEPQFYIDQYDNDKNIIDTNLLNIERNEIPTNGNSLKKTIAIRQPSMVCFTLRFNNFISNGSSGYSAILCSIALKAN